MIMIIKVLFTKKQLSKVAKFIDFIENAISNKLKIKQLPSDKIKIYL